VVCVSRDGWLRTDLNLGGWVEVWTYFYSVNCLIMHGVRHIKA
jgi:hypothetical protein